jgi:adenylate kinase family enzyme
LVTTVADRQRTLIIGNGGSGKTWLAGQLAALSGLPTIHLDDLRWEPGQYGKARDNQLVMDEVVQAAEAEAWLMEGVYGWLAKAVIGRATQLIWIDLMEEECLANVRARGIQGGGCEADFEALLTWISEYRLRNNSSCFAAHLQLFEGFEGTKVRLTGRGEMAGHLRGVR